MKLGHLQLLASRRIHRLSSLTLRPTRVKSARSFTHLPETPLQSFTSSVFSRQETTAPQPIQPPENLPLDQLVDEENVPHYNPERFYPANPSEILDGRFELLAKLGWGTSSIVWLARDKSWSHGAESRRYVAIKICTSDAVQEETSHELDITIHLSSTKSEHRGRAILGTAIQSFGINSSWGSEHLVLVFEPMREPLWLFRRHLMGEDKTLREWMPLVKVYFQILLEGLDFLHSEGHVVHTDLKLDNLMVTFEDESVIGTFVKRQTEQPMARKVTGGRTIYRCHNNFGHIQDNEALKKMVPNITDFGLAQRGDKPGPHVHPIQPNDYQAPEVLLGTGWSYSADIWNFGVVVWDFLAGHGLFQQNDARQYSPVEHLAEMIALIGPVPPKMIQRERDMRQWKWRPEARNDKGKLCSSAAEFYGGPFFTDQGEFVRKDLIPHDRSLRREMPDCISEGEAEMFLMFMRRMLRWLPEDRATAKELKDDPWLTDGKS